MRRFAVVLSFLLLATGWAPADDEDDLPHRLMPFAVQDTNAARFAVRETRRLLASGRTRQALRLAQEVLDEMPNDYYRVASTDETTRWCLAAEEIRDILAGLGDEERATYDELSRPSTKTLLERASLARNPVVLTDLADRFGASTAGRRAARLLSDIALEEGRPRDAAWWARAGLRYAGEDAGLWQRLVDALGSAGDGAALADLRLPATLESLPGEERVDVRARLARLQSRHPPVAAADGWPLWGGSIERNRIGAAPGPRLESLRWEIDVTLPRGALDRNTLRGGMGQRRETFERHWQSFRPVHPVVDARTVYLSDGRSVKAVDLYSGTELWTFDHDSTRVLPLLRSGGSSDGRTSFERVFTPVLTQTQVLSTVEVWQRYEREMLQGVEITTHLPRRLLVSLDRASGEPTWWLGMHPEDEEALEGVSIVSPCVVAEGLVVAVASRYESYHHVFLMAFEEKTGRLAWRRSLAWGQQESNLFGSPVKELSASAPAIADGTVYASMGLGFVAALDLHDGRPRWLASYDIQPIEAVQFWYTAPVRFPLIGPSPVIVADDALLVAPTDGRHLHAFERKDGALRWRVPYPTTRRIGAPAQFLGAAEAGTGKVALLTGADLLAYRLDNGELAWIGRMQDEYGEQNVPVGRGALTRDRVLVPTSNGLVRFSLRREGSFEGRDPWPLHVQSGNVLPLPQVLLVTSRERLQAFYSWEEIEQDVAARRKARPGDPTVLLEAGEIYRMGGALDRAERTFREALALAERANDAEGRSKAARGLFRTWLTAASLHGEEAPADARAALEEALRWAQTPTERVRARVQLDTLLKSAPQERIRNLERLVEEADGIQAQFPGVEETVPARAMALLKLARVHVEQTQPAAALKALQRVLRDEGDASIVGHPARDLARAMITEILNVWGTDAYARFETEARGLLERAVKTGDPQLLDRLLREFPNATVVPEALLGLGAARLEKGDVVEAAVVLRSLLADHPHADQAARGAALLARAYERAGLDGARRFALAWLAARHPRAQLELDGRTVDAQTFAREKAPPPRLPLPETSRTIAPPLEEVHFEAVDEESWGRQIEVATEGTGPSPIALLSDSRDLVGFDLVHARHAFRLSTGPYHRALYSDGVLVLGAGRSLKGVTADRAQPLWDLDIDGTVLDLEGAHGQAYVLMQDAAGRRGSRRILAVDATRGRIVWHMDLEGGADVREIQPYGPDLLLRELRNQGGRLWPTMLVVDGLTGRMRHIVTLPAESRTDGEPLLVGDVLVVASRDATAQRHVSGHALATGEVAWSRELPTPSRVCGLVADGDRFVVLQEDGHLGTYRSDNGLPTEQTRVYTGDGSAACPFHGTSVLLDSARLYLMPRASRPPWFVGAWDRRTGKLAWHTPWEEKRSPGRSVIALLGHRILALTPYASNRAAGNDERPPARVLLRILDADTGALLQEIEPVGLAPDYGLISMAWGWGTVVVFGKAGAGLYAAPKDR